MLLTPHLVLNLNQLFPNTVYYFFDCLALQKIESVWTLLRTEVGVKEILFTTKSFSLASDDLEMVSSSPFSCHLPSRFTQFKTWYSICKLSLHKAEDITNSRKKTHKTLIGTMVI